MILAKSGNFVLCHETYLGNRKLTTHCLEICKLLDDNSRYTVAKIDSDGNLKTIDSRILDCIDNLDDLENLKTLSKILYNIKTQTEDIECQ